MGINQYIQIGSKIKQARICKGIRQKDMAEKLGLSVSTYSNYENNHGEPEFDTIKKACFILGMTIDELIYNQPKIGGWIPCSERLPEEGIKVLVWFEYFRYGEYNRLFQTIGISYTYNGKWSGFVNDTSGWEQLNIIAWQPLPEAYHG